MHLLLKNIFIIPRSFDVRNYADRDMEKLKSFLCETIWSR